MTRLEHERRRRGLTQTEMAAKAKLSQGDISLIETRRMVPTSRVLTRLARVLRVASETLLDEVQPADVVTR